MKSCENINGGRSGSTTLARYILIEVSSKDSPPAHKQTAFQDGAAAKRELLFNGDYYFLFAMLSPDDCQLALSCTCTNSAIIVPKD